MDDFWSSLKETANKNKEQVAEVVCGTLSLSEIAEITKQLPVIEWVAKTYGVITAFQSVFFHKKLLRFIKNTTDENVDLKEVYSVISQMQNKSYDDGLAVFFKVIDEVYTMQQVDIISNLAIAYNNKDITEIDFVRLVSIARRCITHDLNALRSFDSKKYIEGVAESLNSLGLISIVDHDGNKNPLYQMNHTGYKMLRWGIGDYTAEFKSIVYNIGKIPKYIEETGTLQLG